jgi:hypothetical protein
MITPQDLIQWAMIRGWRWRPTGGLVYPLSPAHEASIEIFHRAVAVRINYLINGTYDTHVFEYYTKIIIHSSGPTRLKLKQIRGLPESAGGTYAKRDHGKAKGSPWPDSSLVRDREAPER